MQFDFFSRKKFKCVVCGKGFKSEAELQDHKKLEHEMKGP
ncbi:MAG: hypothetical protein GEU26_12375 [Nitrososphaeraceae archaeon]|jgi:uncharacterized protein (DUF2225 family)|nr:hypothetical protein [Nitrososphaeraceae archaeon]